MNRVIHWFRRDLRVTDNTALLAAAANSTEIVPVFVLSQWKASHRWTGPNRQQFLCESLASLDANLRALGGRLVFRRGDAVEELLALARETRAKAIFFNRDPDPFGRATEERLRTAAATIGVTVHDFKDVTIFERSEVLTGSGDPFRVFTPYSKAWLKLTRPPVGPRLRNLSTPPEIRSDALPTLETWGLSGAATLEPGGEKAARHRLRSFVNGPLARYGRDRNTPAGRTTSRLSQDLRHGTLSIREVFETCAAAEHEAPPAARQSITKFLAELIWREFYIAILWHYPEVLDAEFNPRFRNMPWPGDPARLELWKTGQTGFPIVDAAMRELNETGFMHNRTRMITAMFLTKDLHLDWRHGEQFFMQKLVDGEIASNNGGWQWSAGTGADAAPYFRIQNPWTQTSRYDPDGTYIRRWIPELRDVPAARLCEPPQPGSRLAKNYPPPIVDHAKARDTTLELFSAHRTLTEPA
jgi:deoxyribodipyrimidine photo-lyase